MLARNSDSSQGREVADANWGSVGKRRRGGSALMATNTKVTKKIAVAVAEELRPLRAVDDFREDEIIFSNASKNTQVSLGLRHGF